MCEPARHRQGTTAVSWVVPLEQLLTADRGGAGSKAVNLGVMIRAGLPVPQGFCVTSPAFLRWLDASPTVQPSLDQLERFEARQTEEVRQAAAELRQHLATIPLPEFVQTAIVAECERRGPAVAWAVRSSATAEDLPEASFAGQHDSLLNVSGSQAVLAAVRSCWISLFTDRAVSYRLKNRIPHRDAAMAVVVQEMVPAEVSGVIFTADTGGTATGGSSPAQ